MNMKYRTKLMFADQLEKMLRTMPLEKVRISKLCELCGTTPQTFYYHFHDKYELIAWIFLWDLESATANITTGYTLDFISSITSKLEQRRPFYRKAFTDKSQNSISEYLLAFNTQLSMEVVLSETGKPLSPEQIMAVRYHVYGLVGLYRDFFLDDNSESMPISKFLFEKTPDFIKSAFARYPYSADIILQKAGK